MPPPSPAATDVATRLLAAVSHVDAAVGGAHADDEESPAGSGGGERVLAGLADALARWFGPYGYHALLSRALAIARADHPSLSGVRVRAPLTPILDGLREAGETHGRTAMNAAVVAVVAGVIDLLGRVIGEDMAVHLVERMIEPPVALEPRMDQPAKEYP